MQYSKSEREIRVRGGTIRYSDTRAMIPRALSALLLSVIYAAFAGVCTLVWWRLTHDPAHPGPMIPDNIEWGRLMAFFITLVAAVLGAFVALSVSLTQSRKLYSAIFGAAVGVVLFLMYLADILKVVPSRYHTRTEIWLSLPLWFLIFPVGLAMLATAASALSGRIKRRA